MMDRNSSAAEPIAPRRRDQPSTLSQSSSAQSRLRLEVLATLPDLRYESPTSISRRNHPPEATQPTQGPHSRHTSHPTEGELVEESVPVATGPSASETHAAERNTTLRSRRAARNQRRSSQGNRWLSLGMFFGFAAVGLGFCLAGYVVIAGLLGSGSHPTEIADSWNVDLKPADEMASPQIEIGVELEPWSPSVRPQLDRTADRRTATPTERPWVGLEPRGETAGHASNRETNEPVDPLDSTAGAVPSDQFHAPSSDMRPSYEYSDSRETNPHNRPVVADPEASPLDDFGYPRTDSVPSVRGPNDYPDDYRKHEARNRNSTEFEEYDYPRTSEDEGQFDFQPTSTSGRRPQVREYRYEAPPQSAPSFEISDQGTYPGGGYQSNPYVPPTRDFEPETEGYRYPPIEPSNQQPNNPRTGFPPLPSSGAGAPNPWDRRPQVPYTTDDAGVARLQGTIQQQPIR